MQIVGIETAGRDGLHVHTIDVWYSGRRKLWIVERLDQDGHQIGLTYCCADEQEASSCVAEWLRSHDETHLIAPRQATAAEKRILAGNPKRRAA